jgi:hypothetical protein
MSLKDLTDPKAVERAIAECDTRGREAFLAHYGFRVSRDFMLRARSGRLYDSKAIVGVAYGYQYPERGPLHASGFSGGRETVVPTLRRLGFEVVELAAPVVSHDPPTDPAPDVWTRAEVELAVADYFDMLALEASGIAYNKSERNERLRSRLPARSKGSVERKHQNISAALDELGLPFIRGYKPLANFQALLRDVVREAILAHRPKVDKIIDDLQVVHDLACTDYQVALVPAPPGTPQLPASPRWVPRKLDYAARDERNRKLGRAGEEWVLGYERDRLRRLGRGDLAAGVDWTADRLGDGAGYDIQSFEVDESPRYIEVKTTNGGALTPFVVSRNEVEFSRTQSAAFYLYRMFDFAAKPQFFIVKGDLNEALALTPMDYRARVKAR